MYGDVVKCEGEGWVMLRDSKRCASLSEAARAIILLASIGMPWEAKRHGYEDWFGWNGKALRLNESISDILHEMAHWVVATEKERPHSDFMLEQGAGHPDARKIEQRASMLGILLERAMDLPWADTFVEHSWRDYPSGLRSIIDDMRRIGLLRDMTPTFLRPVLCLPSSSGSVRR